MRTESRPKLLQHLVRHQAETRPSAAAIVADGTRLTYSELEAASNRLARLLRAAGCRQGDRVAVLARKSAMAIVALLGIYKADAIYVPLDPASPAGRLNKILDACQCHWLLVSRATEPLLDEIERARDGKRPLLVGSLDRQAPGANRHQPIFTLDDVEAYSPDPVETRNTPHDPAHILFTPKPTGMPSGVVVSHESVLRFVEWATAYFEMDESDRVSAHAPLHFDLSFFDLFGAAAVGGEVHLVPPELNLAPARMADFIRDHELTQWFSVPSILNHMAKFDVIGFNEFPSLDRVLWTGEVLPTSALIYWMQRLPHTTFTNLYGPTETTIASSYYTVPECPKDAHTTIPIGRACAGEELLVLNEALAPVSPGEPGDLYIAGVGLARGYWGDPDRTAEAFLHHPHRPAEWIYKTGDLARVGDDGAAYLVGHLDSPITNRCDRVDLSEVEAAVNAVPAVVEGVVLGVTVNGFDSVTVCCAYAPAAGQHMTPAMLRETLASVAPQDMLPTRWLCLDELPIDANGKIDRRRLKDAFAAVIDASEAKTA